MKTANNAQKDSGSMIYGFLCEATNVFYAFDTIEEYKQFLAWLKNEDRERIESDFTVSDDEILQDSERATEDIMEVFNDPVFQHKDGMMDLEKIDF